MSTPVGHSIHDPRTHGLRRRPLAVAWSLLLWARQPATAVPESRQLRFVQTHTDELTPTFWRDGAYAADALERFTPATHESDFVHVDTGRVRRW